MKVLEKSIEEHLIDRVRSMGGVCIKLKPFGNTGLPDRLVVLPEGRVVFVELKRPKGGVVAAKQTYWIKTLKALGVEAHVWNTKEQIDEGL